MPVEWIGVRCVECLTYQSIQRPKPRGTKLPSSRFSCRLCSHPQSVQHVFAVSYNANDVRLGQAQQRTQRLHRSSGRALLTGCCCPSLCAAVQRKNAAREVEQQEADRRALERLQREHDEGDDDDEEDEHVQEDEQVDAQRVPSHALPRLLEDWDEPHLRVRKRKWAVEEEAGQYGQGGEPSNTELDKENRQLPPPSLRPFDASSVSCEELDRLLAAAERAAGL